MTLLEPASEFAVDVRAAWSRGVIARTVCGATELPRRVGVTPATASHHVSVSRDAGLKTSRRVGGTVRHRITSPPSGQPCWVGRRTER